jgi:AraC-like DNA-binding protein
MLGVQFSTRAAFQPRVSKSEGLNFEIGKLHQDRGIHSSDRGIHPGFHSFIFFPPTHRPTRAPFPVPPLGPVPDRLFNEPLYLTHAGWERIEPGQAYPLPENELYSFQYDAGRSLPKFTLCLVAEGAGELETAGKSQALTRGEVSKLAHRLEISRRTLERCFKQATGRTLHGEIQTCRVERAKRLLVETDIPIKEIVFRAGFNNREQLRQAFAKVSGLSPDSFRLQNAAPDRL